MKSQLDGYTDASRRLLDYAELNKADNQFRATGQIIYVLDTSVVEAYWRRDPKGTAGRYGTSRLLDSDVAVFSGWLALKYLMEQRLPGQKDGAVYISPSHWNEALERVERLSAEMRQNFKKAAKQDVSDNIEARDLNARTAIDAAIRELGGVRDPKVILREAGKLGIADTFVQIMRAVSQQERIRRTFQYGRNQQASVVDLTLCPQYASLADRKMSYADFRRWQAAIGRARRRNEQARDERGSEKDSSRNIDNDATTMASIQAMYRGNPETMGDKPTIRIVFITADAAIHEAYDELLGRLEDEGIPFFLRHPDVYSPLLNHVNMSQSTTPDNFKTLKEVFDRVEEALEPLTNDNDMHSPLAKAYERRLVYNVEIWSRNVLTLCLSNSHYVVPDMEGDYVRAKSLAQLLSAPDVREAAASSVSADISKIRDDHLQTMSLSALEQLGSARLRHSDDGEREHRAPVKLIGVDIADILGFERPSEASSVTWLEDLLRGFRKSHSRQTPELIVERLREHWDDRDRGPAAQILASCIFFAVNSWDNAKLCADICRRRVQRRKGAKHWVREARYCEALSIRMQLRSAEDLQRATDLLAKNITDNVDVLAGLRDRVEIATLKLTAIAVQVMEKSLPIDLQFAGSARFVPTEEIMQEFEEATNKLSEAVAALSWSTKFNDPDMAARIRVQAAINLLGAALFSQLLGDDVLFDDAEPLELAVTREALLSAYRETKFELSLTAQIYIAVSTALEDGGATAAADALEQIKALTDGIHHLSDPDTTEIKYFTVVLNEIAAIGQPA